MEDFLAKLAELFENIFKVTSGDDVAYIFSRIKDFFRNIANAEK